MTHIAEALVMATIIGATLTAIMAKALHMLDAYNQGYEDGKRYACDLLLGDHATLEEYWEWRANRRRTDAGADSAD